MTPEAQRIAIAEACRWKRGHEEEISFLDPDKTIKVKKWVSPNGQFSRCPPDYLHDLNAMHEAECQITVGQIGRYISAISNIVQPQSTYHPLDLQWWSIRATAAQRAEAFLRTIGKWEET